MNNKEMLDGAITILNTLEYNGYEGYIVGGFVRDYLLNNPSHDIDITTNAIPEVLSKLFPDSFNKSDKFKTVTVRMNGYEYEVTTYRFESKYKDHRHPKTKVASRLIDDIKRRDFTINSLCFNNKLELIDLVNGKEDLDNRIIKCVGRPKKRFQEDALRMFRAFRFMSRLNFDIESNTYEAICKCFYLARYISKERIRDEIERMLKEPYFKNSIPLIIRSNVLYCYPALEKALIVLSSNYTPINYLELVTLASYINKNVLNTLSISKKEYRDIEKSLYYIDIIVSKKVSYKNLFDLDYDSLSNAFTVLSILNLDNIYKEESLINYYESLIIKSEKDLDITGTDIKNKLKLPDSPKIKEIKDYLIDECINKKVNNNKQDLLNYLDNYEL